MTSSKGQHSQSSVLQKGYRRQIEIGKKKKAPRTLGIWSHLLTRQCASAYCQSGHVTAGQMSRLCWNIHVIHLILRSVTSE
ncbi:hypothetical protein PoB_001137100 [Plakobranchus ocellatus]|uniref:Uncharacterized protein n=1 Tax=Plakobranchus ocellatus TaxID=259542 RepID=A0AAV3YR67_9GAST|nr:hypothetical protein PoB_001137100 [Plakobranchus ocellatus]